MNETTIGKSNIPFSPMALGTWSFAGGNLWGAVDEQLAIDTVHAALDLGVSVLDSSEGYGSNGESEQVLGKALVGHRQQAVLCTKVRPNHLHRDDLIASCEASLERLKTDYIDLYQIHWAYPEMPLDEIMEAFTRLQQAGKVREIGVCNAGLGCLKSLDGLGFATNQLPYSLLWRVIEQNGVLEQSTQQGLTTWAYSPLAQGLLTGKYHSIDDVPMGRRANRFYNCAWGQGRHTDGGFEAGIFETLDKLRVISQDTGFTISELAMAFLKHHPHVGSVLVGARTPEQIAQNLAAFSASVPESVVALCQEATLPLRNSMGTNADLWEDKNGGRMY